MTLILQTAVVIIAAVGLTEGQGCGPPIYITVTSTAPCKPTPIVPTSGFCPPATVYDGIVDTCIRTLISTSVVQEQTTITKTVYFRPSVYPTKVIGKRSFYTSNGESPEIGDNLRMADAQEDTGPVDLSGSFEPTPEPESEPTPEPEIEPTAELESSEPGWKPDWCSASVTFTRPKCLGLATSTMMTVEISTWTRTLTSIVPVRLPATKVVMAEPLYP